MLGLLPCGLCADSFRILLPVFDFTASAFEIFLEPELGQLCAVPLPHVAVNISGVAPFKLFVDGCYMHAESVGYILRAFSFEIMGLQRLTIGQRQISVVSHVLTSLWCWCILRPFCKICIFGRALLNRPPALRLASFSLGRLDRTGFHLKSRKLVERHGAFLGVAALHRRPVFTLKTGLKTCYPSPINTDFTKWPRGQCCPFCGKKIMRREAFASFRI